jgi:hypothetical protein
MISPTTRAWPSLRVIAPQRRVVSRTADIWMRRRVIGGCGSGRGLCATAFASCFEDDAEFHGEQGDADRQHPGGEDAGPGEAGAGHRIEGKECEASEEEGGAAPSAKARGDLALAFVFGAAEFAEGLLPEALMVVDAAAEGGLERDLFGGVLLGFGEGREDSAGGAGCGGLV